MNNMEIILDETPERFRPMAEQILPSFIKLFQDYARQMTPLMEEFNETFKNNKTGKMSAKVEAILIECKSVKDKLLSKRITGNIVVTPYDTVPSRFEYFLSGGTLRFIMKTAKKITVQTVFTDCNGNITRHKFVLRPSDTEWLIDWFGYGYDEEGSYKKFDL